MIILTLEKQNNVCRVCQSDIKAARTLMDSRLSSVPHQNKYTGYRLKSRAKGGKGKGKKIWEENLLQCFVFPEKLDLQSF